MQIVGASGSSGFMYIYDRDNGTSNTDGFLLQKSGNNAFVYNRESSGSLSLGAGDTSNYLVIDSSGNIDLGSTQILDQSRNLTNIGTISSTYLVADATKTASKTQIRATGWYGSASSSFTGTGVEIGGIGTNGTIIAYDRDASVYRGLNISATAIGLDPRGGSVNITAGGDLTFNGTLVIDENRNLTNIASISSGALTVTADAGNEQITIKRSSNTNEQLIQLILGFHSSDYATIQAVEQNVAFRPLVLQPSGANVGIGTTSPATELDVAGTITASKLKETSGDLTIDSTSTTADLILATARRMRFFEGGSEAMRLDESGRLGIGTTSPSTLLHLYASEW
jgi:hypothetical protein